jgi:tetratricopeptide (TPR) repeat protein
VADWDAIARRQQERSEHAQGDVLRGNAAYGAGLALLMAGDAERARAWFERAVTAYHDSWADAAPDAWGRPIATMKARLLAGESAEEEARWALALGAGDAPTAIGHYAAALACLILGEDDDARVHADAIRTRDDFPAPVGDALAMISAGTDAVGFVEAIEAVLESFESRDEYLEDVPVADTVIVLTKLAEQRGLPADLDSPLLPKRSA